MIYLKCFLSVPAPFLCVFFSLVFNLSEANFQIKVKVESAVTFDSSPQRDSSDKTLLAAHPFFFARFRVKAILLNFLINYRKRAASKINSKTLFAGLKSSKLAKIPLFSKIPLY